MMIRKATERDISQLIDLWKEFLRSQKEYQLFIKVPSIKYSKKFIKKQVNNKKAIFVIAVDKNKVVGFSIAWIINAYPTFKFKKIGYLYDMYIKKKYRGKGIAKKLFGEVAIWYKSKGIKYVALEVFTGNENAYKMWEHFGFKTDMRHMYKLI